MVQMTFSSDNFLPYLPEHGQVNPGAYGFERSLTELSQLERGKT